VQWLVGKFVFFIRHKIMERVDIQIIKNDVRHVKYSSNGKGFGVLVVDIC
jgi:hypothetical protein